MQLLTHKQTRQGLFIALIGFLLLPAICLAQGDSLDADLAFLSARELAYSGRREESRKLLFEIIKRYPDYTEVKSFIARTYAWDGNYDQARILFTEVHEKDPGILENYTGWSDVERWAGNLARSLEIAEQGLAKFENHPELLLRKAYVYARTNRVAEAKSITQKILKIQPGFQEAYILLQQLRSELLYNGISIGYTYEGYSEFFPAGNFSFLQFSHITGLGSVVGRINYGNRSGENELQPEIDLYPKLYKTVYAYLNYGISRGHVFPERRFAAELYSPLSKSFDGSIGFRQLKFTVKTIDIYTASLGMYHKNYLATVRGSIIPVESGNAVSFSLNLRRYFSSPEHFLDLRVSSGSTAEQKPGTADNLHSENIGVSYQHVFNNRIALLLHADLSRHQLSFSPGKHVTSHQFGTNLTYRFK